MCTYLSSRWSFDEISKNQSIQKDCKGTNAIHRYCRPCQRSQWRKWIGYPFIILKWSFILIGNQFLGNIRGVDMVLHVLRCFEDPDIIHVENSIDPIRGIVVLLHFPYSIDLEIVNNELLLADLQLLEKQRDKVLWCFLSEIFIDQDEESRQRHCSYLREINWMHI